MDDRLRDTTEGYRERIQRLALFDPLYQLEQKKGRDRQERRIDYFGLGLLTLLFFFENMLMRNKRTGVQELAHFLQEMNQGEIDYTQEEFEKLARNIIETFRPPSGKRFSRQFYNWETRKEETVEISILKAERADLESNKQYYSLDEDGLELVFSTKEFFREFHLSINQLLLRKQLEKGEFVSALRQIDEMRIDVETLQQRIVKIKHEVQRNIISEETFLRYKHVIDDINSRLYREHEEFRELQIFVKDTRERLGYERNDEKEQRTYEYMIRIDRELEEVHSEHTKLLKDSIELKTTALQAAKESLYYVAIQSFNFDQEIGARLISTPLPLHVARTLIEPFLYFEHHLSWSPLAVFEKQRVGSEQERDDLNSFEEISNVRQELDAQIQRENFGQLLVCILDLMGEMAEIRLSEVVRCFQESNHQSWLENRSFYDFWLLTHQKSPISYANDEEQHHVLQAVTQLLRKREQQLSVVELPDLILVTSRYTIQDMILKLEVIKNAS